VVSRTVLVTGCSSGFGLETSVLLARRGWHVLATMRDLERRDVLDRTAAGAGVRVEVLQLDVTDGDSIARAVNGIGSLDALVHNAGIGDAGFFTDMPDETVRTMMETHFFGVLELTRRALPALRAARSSVRARIVVVSSVGAFFPQPALSAYVASKWAVEGWAEVVAMELRPMGIDVVLVEPGTFKTAIWTSATVARPSGSPYGAVVDRLQPRLMQIVQRFGRDPRVVAVRIADLLEASRPRFRNPVGADAWALWAAGRLVPAGARRRLLGRLVGLDRLRP
jgi:NAD(P)-dependent dehydrogenase (short-subunit alcohol dehydrogenase family)